MVDSRGNIKTKSSKWFVFVCFVFNWRDCTVKTGSARKLGQSPICHYPRSSAHWGYFRQSLTRLVQNLTLRNDCNLIPSAHGTQQLSSQCNHWTIRGFTSWSLPNLRPVPKTWSEDWQCTAFAVSIGWFPHTGFEHSTFHSKGKHANRHTTNALSFGLICISAQTLNLCKCKILPSLLETSKQQKSVNVQKALVFISFL